MRHRWFALGAVVSALAILAIDYYLLDIPQIRNGPATFLALLVPLGLAVIALKLVRSILTIVALGIVLLLGAGYAASRTVLIQLPSVVSALKLGDPAPEFRLPSTAGRELSLKELRGEGQLVLVFYRGAW